MDELKWLLGQYGLPCTLTLSGALSLTGGVGMKALCTPGFLGVQVCLFDEFQPVASVPIFSFDFPCGPINQTQFVTLGLDGAGHQAAIMQVDTSTQGKHVDVSIINDRLQNPAFLRFNKYDAAGNIQRQDFALADLQAAGVTSLVVEGTAGDDIITIDPKVTSVVNIQYVTVNAEAGNDSVDFGPIDPTTSHLLATFLNGQDGNDTLTGGAGDDYLDGGTGANALVGNAGDDELVNSFGTAGGTLDGGAGNDVMIASNFGDTMTGGAGRDQMYGGAGADIMSGGAGNDTISGDGGDDRLFGGAGGDVLYGQNATNVGGDNGSDIIYGDYGTDGNEAGGGADTLVGQGTADSLFGEGNDDVITPSASPGERVDRGINTPNSLFPSADPTPAVTPFLPVGETNTLPTGPDFGVRWSELSGSASGLGLSASPNVAAQPAIAASSTAQYVAWADNREGAYQIYVAKHTASGWTELAGSSHGVGISNAATDSTQPSVTLDAGGNPIIVWTTGSAAPSDIEGVRFDGTAWVPLGPSLGAGGISQTGHASNAHVVNTAAGPVVSWLDSSGGAANVLDGGSGNLVVHNLSSVSLTNGTVNPLVEYNYAGNLVVAASSNILVRGNWWIGGGGVSIVAAASGEIGGNRIVGGAVGLNLAAPFTGPITGNDIQGPTGVQDGANAALYANRIHGGSCGVIVAASATLNFGGTGAAVPNEIFGNSNGVQLSGPGAMQGQHIFGNGLGVLGVGAGVLGPSSLDQANLIELNTTGVDFPGTIQFNRIARNTVGIKADGANVITNNLIYRNTQTGVLISGLTGVQVANNTFYDPQGDGVHLQGGSANITVKNNVMWSQNGYDLYIATDSQAGFVSDYNLLGVGPTGVVGFWQGAPRVNFGAWQNATFTDADSLSQDPLFVNAPADDYHDRSLYGSFHGGTLAPVLNAATGLPAPNPGTVSLDAVQSPAIDRGDPTTPFANEPAPNGNFVNLGAYGNTAQASKSPTTYVFITRPAGGEIWPEAQTFPITWRAETFTGTVNLDLYQVGGATPVLNIAAGVADNGLFIWTVPTTLTPASNYLVQVTRLDGSGLSDFSNAAFTIAPVHHSYYVNDGTVAAGDWTTAPGNDANDGLTAATPKASVSGVLAAYHLTSLDTILVDNGTYNLTANIVITSDDAGVSIQGYNNSANPTGAAVLNRGNPNPGSYVFELQAAAGVTLDHLQMTGSC